MRIITLTIAFFIFLHANTQCPANFFLETFYNENNGQAGQMLDITAINDVTILCFDVNLYTGTHDYQIYYKNGTHVGFEGNQGAWTLIGGLISVTSNGTNVPTYIPIDINVPIAAGQTAAFYITCNRTNTPGGGIEYTNGTGVGNLLEADLNIQVFEGTGKAWPFGNNFTPRQFNGAVYYDACSDLPEIDTVIVTNAICEENGQLLVEASGGTGTYEYSIDNGINFQEENIFEDLEAGSYDVIVRDDGGCQSLVSVVVIDTQGDLPTISHNFGDPENLCVGEDFTFNVSTTNATDFDWQGPNGVSFDIENPSLQNVSSNDSGDYILIASNEFCVSEPDTITLNVAETDTTFETLNSCNPSDTGIVVENLLNQFGCDSIHTITTSLLQSDSTFVEITTCDENETEGVEILGPFENQFGCDSTHTITTTVFQSDSTFFNTTSCNPEDEGVEVLGPFANQFGCDSTHTITTTLLPTDSSFINSTTCFEAEADEIVEIFTNQFGCDSVIITTIELLENNYSVFPDFVVLEGGETLEFIVNNEDGNLEFSWISTDGTNCALPCESYILNPSEQFTDYYFTLLDTSIGCENLDTITIELEFFSELNIPNAFTPNNDGENDIYRVYGENIFEYSLMIFDRWGGKVFETNDLNEGWDGTFKGQALKSGVYIGIINATGFDAKRYNETINIKLIR